MSVEVISALFTGLTSLFTGYAGLRYSRNKQLEKTHTDLLRDFKLQRQELGLLRELDLLKTRHIYAAEKAHLSGEPFPEIPMEIKMQEEHLENLEDQAIKNSDNDK